MSKSLIVKLIICLLVIILFLTVATGIILFNKNEPEISNIDSIKNNNNKKPSSQNNVEPLFEAITVPSVIGKTEQEARQILRNTNLKYITVITSYSDKANGVVVNQFYEKGTIVPENTPILIMVNKYEKTQEPEEEVVVVREPVYYKGFVVVGYIEIPKIELSYPVLENGSDISLEASVAVMYPANPVLNTPGNIIIMGHNYRNGKFFSNLQKLSIGDKVFIEDLDGKKLTYTIYDMYEVKPEDVDYITRDTRGGTEITLYTCTDDGARRLIALAKAE